LFPEIYDEGICICAHDTDTNLYIYLSIPFSYLSAAATPGRPDCWTWRKSLGSRMTRSILNILTGGLPFWTTLRPLLFLMWPSSVAFSFRDGARKVSTGLFSSSFTGKTQSVTTQFKKRNWILFFFVNLNFQCWRPLPGCRKSAKKCVPGVRSASGVVHFPSLK
jgi:hypothetical protein